MTNKFPFANNKKKNVSNLRSSKSNGIATLTTTDNIYNMPL